MLTGYSIIAVPTGIFTAESRHRDAPDPANLLQRDCPVCRKATHEVQAAFCCRCGNPLFPREEGSHGEVLTGSAGTPSGSDSAATRRRMPSTRCWRPMAGPTGTTTAIATSSPAWSTSTAGANWRCGRPWWSWRCGPTTWSTTQRQDNEAASAASTEHWLDQAGLAALRPALRELDHGHLRHQAPPGDADAALVVDIDLAILAAPAPVYARYEADVRAEYAWVPEPLFRAGRGKCCASCWSNRRCTTEPLRQRWEAAARANLRGALERLEQPA